MEFHCHVSIGKTSRGQNAVGRCAYIEGEKMTDPVTGKAFNHTSKEEVVFGRTYLPKNAPQEWAENPKKMWSVVQDVEMFSKSNNPQLYREFEISLPNELTIEQEKKIIDSICSKLTTDGMCCTAGLHQKAGNHHVHIMTPLRRLDEHEKGRFLPKSRTSYKLDKNGNKIPVIDKKTGQQALDHKGGKRWKTQTENLCWNKKEYVKEWREMVCAIINKELPQECQLDHRSYKARGINLEPTVHHYGLTSRKNINTEIRKHNAVITEHETSITALKKIIAIEKQKEQRELMGGKTERLHIAAKLYGGGGRAVGAAGVLKANNRLLLKSELKTLQERDTPDEEENWSIDIGGMSYGGSGVNDVIRHNGQAGQPAEPVRQRLDLPDRETSSRDYAAKVRAARMSETNRRIAEIRRERVADEARQGELTKQAERERSTKRKIPQRTRNTDRELTLSR